jgi:ABC-type antimicrobial peptide transport system permease subunit
MIIIKAQDSYLRNFDLGFDKNNLLIVSNTTDLEAHDEGIRTDLLSIPEIESVSFSSCIPARGTKISNEVNWEGKDTPEKLSFWCINADFSYAKTVNIKISEGRYFDRSYPSDSASFVINDVAAKAMGYENPVGRTMTLENKKGTIIGVFRDFHAVTPTGPIAPIIISLAGRGRNNLLIKIAPGNYPAVCDKINKVFSRYESEKTFQVIPYSYLLARTELTTVTYFAGLAFIISILLACLGLSGLASFTAASRTKEIGIRKINGASVFSIIRLLGMNFTKWLTIASIISIPLAFIIGNIFLSRFHNHVPIPYWAFFAGPVIAYLIALSTVIGQCWKSSSLNPVDALRYE